MLHKQVGDVFKYFLILFLIVNINALSPRKKSTNLLNRLLELSVRHNEPLVIILENEALGTSDNRDFANKHDVMDVEYDLVHPNYHPRQDKDGGYFLERLLRTSNDDASLSKAKSVLRALRMKCQQVYMCVQECPKKKPSCPQNCQQVFDSLNLCATPSTPPRKELCKKPKCGRTMPPSWRFLL